MLITVPWWRQGQQKPFPSIPRINWAHPITQGLVTYCYDCGGGVFIDLVSGQVGSLYTSGTPTAAKPFTSKYGSGWQFAQQASATPASAVSFPVNIRTDNLCNVAPYSFACGFMPAVSINATGNFATLWSIADASANTQFNIGDNGSGQPLLSFSNSGSSGFGTARTWVIGNFTTIVGVMTAATTSTGYYADSSGFFTTSNFTAQTLNSLTGLQCNIADAKPTTTTTLHSNFFNGFIFYGAAWSKRLLNVQDARFLQDNPWGFLIYPEDEIFANLVGVTAVATSVTWAPWMMDEMAFNAQIYNTAY